MKFADLERETEAANARADAAEEREKAAYALRDEVQALASARVKDANARELDAGRLIAIATDATQRASRLERMVRQALWRDTFLVYLPAVTKTSMVTPEEAVDFARRAADAAAKLEPPAPRIDATDEPLSSVAASALLGADWNGVAKSRDDAAEPPTTGPLPDAVVKRIFGEDEEAQTRAAPSVQLEVVSGSVRFGQMAINGVPVEYAVVGVDCRACGTVVPLRAGATGTSTCECGETSLQWVDGALRQTGGPGNIHIEYQPPPGVVAPQNGDLKVEVAFDGDG